MKNLIAYAAGGDEGEIIIASAHQQPEVYKKLSIDEAKMFSEEIMAASREAWVKEQKHRSIPTVSNPTRPNEHLQLSLSWFRYSKRSLLQDWYGSNPEVSQTQVWLHNRGLWKMGQTPAVAAMNIRRFWNTNKMVTLADITTRRVVAVAQVAAVSQVTLLDLDLLPNTDHGRVIFLGECIEDHPMVGQPWSEQNGRWPVNFVAGHVATPTEVEEAKIEELV